MKMQVKRVLKLPAFAHLLLGNDGHRSPYLDKFTPIWESIVDQLDDKTYKSF